MVSPEEQTRRQAIALYDLITTVVARIQVYGDDVSNELEKLLQERPEAETPHMLAFVQSIRNMS